MSRDKEKILEELDEVSRQLNALSNHVMYLVDEIDPMWRKRCEKARKAFLKDFKI